MVFSVREAFLGSAKCCGLRFCYVWGPTPNSKCPRWSLPEKMTTAGGWGGELVKLGRFSVQNRVFLGQEPKFGKKKIRSNKIE